MGTVAGAAGTPGPGTAGPGTAGAAGTPGAEAAGTPGAGTPGAGTPGWAGAGCGFAAACLAFSSSSFRFFSRFSRRIVSGVSCQQNCTMKSQRDSVKYIGLFGSSGTAIGLPMPPVLPIPSAPDTPG